jgi:hypothetical protein
MSAAFRCEVCNYARDVPDDYAGRKIRCPQCDAPVEVPAPPPDPAAAPAPEDTRPCPFCAEPIKREARKCRWCGEIVDRELAIAKQQEKVKEIERRREVLLREAPGAKASLIVGIVGLILGPLTIFGGFALGPLAIVMAVSAKSAIRKEPRLEGQGMATAGLILGALTLAATVAMLVTNVRTFGAGDGP